MGCPDCMGCPYCRSVLISWCPCTFRDSTVYGPGGPGLALCTLCGIFIDKSSGQFSSVLVSWRSGLVETVGALSVVDVVSCSVVQP